MSSRAEIDYHWLKTGEEAFAAMLQAIENAKESVRLEMYIFRADAMGEQFRQVLINACRRGLKVRVLIDALGSYPMPDSFWKVFRSSGGEFRRFNPIIPHRMSIRDHRKILVCDETVAFIGGFNIASAYAGDGVKSGWRDLGLKISGTLAPELADAFDDMFESADFRHRPFTRLRKSFRQKTVTAPEAKLLLGGPSRNNPIKRALRADMKGARVAQFISPYFLPPWRIRRQLTRLARAGARVQIIVPGLSDVPLTQLASQSFYRRLLLGGVEIYEYEPQILHTKLFLIDSVVYVGSTNLDSRSLSINYELMVRLSNPKLEREGKEIFEETLKYCRRVNLEDWRKSRNLWDRIKARLAYLLLARVDPFIADKQWRMLGFKKMQSRKTADYLAKATK